MTTYYVTTSGSDSNNGLSEGTAFATPGYAAGQARTSGDIVYIKEGTYSLTTASSNVSGGVLSVAAGVKIEGYKTSAGDRLALAKIDTGILSSVGNIVTVEAAGFNVLSNTVALVEADGKSVASYGFYAVSNHTSLIENCIARNCSIGIRVGTDNTQCFGSSAFNCTNAGFYGSAFAYCFADSCADGFEFGERLFCCIAANSSTYGFFIRSFRYDLLKCVAFNSGSDGFNATNASDIGSLHQCIASGNGGFGYRLAGSTSGSPVLVDCADYDNSSGRNYSTNARNYRPINLTTDPFTSASTGDFTLNSDAGGGAELRQIQLSGLAGVNSVFDIGAIDAVVTAGGGGSQFHPLG